MLFRDQIIAIIDSSGSSLILSEPAHPCTGLAVQHQKNSVGKLQKPHEMLQLSSVRIPARSSLIAAPGRAGAVATEQVRDYRDHNWEDISGKAAVIYGNKALCL